MPAKSPEAIAKKRANEKIKRNLEKQRFASEAKARFDGRTPEQAARKKEKMKEWRRLNIDHQREYARKKIENLAPAYLALKIGLPLCKVPNDVLEAKKQQLALSRDVKKLVAELKINVAQH